MACEAPHPSGALDEVAHFDRSGQHPSGDDVTDGGAGFVGVSESGEERANALGALDDAKGDLGGNAERPVVESLVRRGVFVEVWYEGKSASAELPWAADYGRNLDFRTLYNWSTARFQNNHALPALYTAHAPVVGDLIKRGRNDGREVLLVKYPNVPQSVLHLVSADGERWYEHVDHGVLERYVPLIHGAIEWE